MDFAQVVEKLIDFIVNKWFPIELQFAGITFTAGSVIIFVAVAGLVLFYFSKLGD